MLLLWCKESRVYSVPLNYHEFGSLSWINSFCQWLFLRLRVMFNKQQLWRLASFNLHVVLWEVKNYKASFRLKNLICEYRNWCLFCCSKEYEVKWHFWVLASCRYFLFTSYSCVVMLLRANIQLSYPALPGLTWHVKWK